MLTPKGATQRPFKLALLLVPMVLLPGCAPIDWIKEKLGMGKQRADVIYFEEDTENLAQDGSAALATIGNKVIISEKSLGRDFDRLLEDNPQFKQMLPMIPDAKFNFLKGMVSQAVVDKDVADKKIDQSEAYRKEFARTMRSVRSMLNTKYFSEQYPVELSDADIQKFYDENKTQMADFLVSRGGVNAVGVSCKTEAEAKDMATRAKGKDLAKVAETAGKKSSFRDFKLVNDQSMGMDTAVRAKIVGMKKFPAVEVVKATDGKFWCVSAKNSEDPKYRPFEQVKDGLKQYLEKEKRMEKINGEIERLSSEYKVVINEQYFKPENDQTQQAGPRVAEVSVEEPAQSAARVA